MKGQMKTFGSLGTKEDVCGDSEGSQKIRESLEEQSYSRNQKSFVDGIKAYTEQMSSDTTPPMNLGKGKLCQKLRFFDLQ